MPWPSPNKRRRKNSGKIREIERGGRRPHNTCQYFRDAFDVYDMNKDGKISKTELIQTFKMLGEEITEDYAEIVMSKIDKDKDGKINFEEFNTFFENK